MSTPELAVEIKGLTKKYGKFLALDNLDLEVEAGQILGFVGPNGAGKTTTIKILVGLARPTKGSAKIAGVDCIRQARKIKRIVGFMPDTFGSYDNMRVTEYLDFFGAAFSIRRKERIRRIDEVLELARATSFRDSYVEVLSHGMKQRVALARTLLHNPSVLILDEPANGLDPQARIEMRQLLLDLADQGKTLLVTSHILPELARVCQRVAIISKGRLRAIGTLPEISRQLNQTRPFEVLLTSSDQIDTVSAIVRRHVEENAPVESSSAESAVRFQTAKTEDELATLLVELVGKQVGVTQFREVQTDLEEAFMTIARGDAQETVEVAEEDLVEMPVGARK